MCVLCKGGVEDWSEERGGWRRGLGQSLQNLIDQLKCLKAVGVHRRLFNIKKKAGLLFQKCGFGCSKRSRLKRKS